MSAVHHRVFAETGFRAVYLAGRILKALVRPNLNTTLISFAYSDLVEIDWVPLYRGDGEMYLSVHAKISIVSGGCRFSRRAELGLLQGVDVLLGRDLLRPSISFRSSRTSTSCWAAPSAKVYPLRGAT